MLVHRVGKHKQTRSEWDVKCWQIDLVPFCLCRHPLAPPQPPNTHTHTTHLEGRK